jgi:hypothetical protein
MAIFGYNTIGAGTSAASTGYVHASGTSYTPAANGTVDSIEIYEDGDGSVKQKAALYDVDGNLVGQTVETVIADGAGWKTLNISGTVNVTAGTYYILAFKHDASTIATYRDTGSDSRLRNTVAYASAFPDPISWDTLGDTLEFSARVNYTESAGGGRTQVTSRGQSSNRGQSSGRVQSANRVSI